MYATASRALTSSYDLNAENVSFTDTTNTIVKFTSATTIGNTTTPIFESGSRIGIGSDNGDKSGYIDQDIIKIGFPHLVSGIPNDDVKQETDSDSYTSPDKIQLSMNYDQVVPLLDVALKNALERIEQLEKEIELLKNRL